MVRKSTHTLYAYCINYIDYNYSAILVVDSTLYFQWTITGEKTTPT